MNEAKDPITPLLDGSATLRYCSLFLSVIFGGLVLAKWFPLLVGPPRLYSSLWKGMTELLSCRSYYAIADVPPIRDIEPLKRFPRQETAAFALWLSERLSAGTRSFGTLG